MASHEEFQSLPPEVKKELLDMLAGAARNAVGCQAELVKLLTSIAFKRKYLDGSWVKKESVVTEAIKQLSKMFPVGDMIRDILTAQKDMPLQQQTFSINVVGGPPPPLPEPEIKQIEAEVEEPEEIPEVLPVYCVTCGEKQEGASAVMAKTRPELQCLDCWTEKYNKGFRHMMHTGDYRWPKEK